MKTTRRSFVIDFDSEAMAQGFAQWLCGSGEQEYWLWRDCRDDPENTATNFDYFELSAGQFGTDIRALRTE